MKIIYGFEESYVRCLARAGIDYLLIRRCKLAENFAIRTSVNPSFSDWFSLSEPSQYALRRELKYQEFLFRTERLRGAPIYMFRRLLNSLDRDQNSGR